MTYNWNPAYHHLIWLENKEVISKLVVTFKFSDVSWRQKATILSSITICSVTATKNICKVSLPRIAMKAGRSILPSKLTLSAPGAPPLSCLYSSFSLYTLLINALLVVPTFLLLLLVTEVEETGHEVRVRLDLPLAQLWRVWPVYTELTSAGLYGCDRWKS